MNVNVWEGWVGLGGILCRIELCYCRSHRDLTVCWKQMHKKDRYSIKLNCQNCTFWSVHGIWKFFGSYDFIWVAMKVPLFDFIQKMSQALSSSVQVLNWEDKLDYLKNPSLVFKNYFYLGSYESITMLEGKIRRCLFFLC